MRPGDKLRDNDPRMPGRVLTIVGIGVKGSPSGCSTSVCTEDQMGRRFSINGKRIHSDGKPRKSGFDLEKS